MRASEDGGAGGAPDDGGASVAPGAPGEGGCSFRQECWEICVLLCCQTRRRSFRSMPLEGFFSAFSSAFDPLACRPLADTQCSCDIFLFPSLLLGFPCLFTPVFSPIGFLWCSHTSFSRLAALTLSLSLARPIVLREPIRLSSGVQKISYMFRKMLWLFQNEVTAQWQRKPGSRKRHGQEYKSHFKVSTTLEAYRIAPVPMDLGRAGLVNARVPRVHGLSRQEEGQRFLRMGGNMSSSGCDGKLAATMHPRHRESASGSHHLWSVAWTQPRAIVPTGDVTNGMK